MIYNNLQDLIANIKKNILRNNVHHTILINKIGINNYQNEFPLIQQEFLGDQNENNPDLLKIYASEKNNIIHIDEIRKIISFSNLKSVKKNKLIAIFNIEDLNTEASNALLKTIEEPHSETFFLLFSENINKINQTIKSRSALYKYIESSHKSFVDEKTNKIIDHLSIKNKTKIETMIENGFFRKYEEFIKNITLNSQYFIEDKITFTDIIEIINRISHIIVNICSKNSIDYINEYEKEIFAKINKNTKKENQNLIKYIFEIKKKIIHYIDYNFNPNEVKYSILNNLSRLIN